MVDSGAFINAINAEVELPDHFIEPLSECSKNKTAESACGGLMHRGGKVRTQGSVKWDAT